MSDSSVTVRSTTGRFGWGHDGKNCCFGWFDLLFLNLMLQLTNRPLNNNFSRAKPKRTLPAFFIFHSVAELRRAERSRSIAHG